MDGLSLTDRIIAAISPTWARNRVMARLQLRAVAGVHQATRPGRLRKIAKDGGSGNHIVGSDAASLRNYARALDRDDDISINALNILEQNVVGSGIGVEPSPRLPGQPVDRELAGQLADLWGDFWLRPEVTWEGDMGKAQRLMCRSWFRDGECFFQRLKGPVPFLDHGTEVPYSIELIEADRVPLDYDDPANNVVQGVQVNAWGRATGYWVLKHHPGESLSWTDERKFVPADRMGKLSLTTRIGQRRGLSAFAGVIARMADLKDYEDAERVAAKIAASLTAYIKKGTGAEWVEGQTTLQGDPQGRSLRSLQMVPGMIIDDLLPGEEIGMIKSDRPNPNAVTWRNGQLRAAAGPLRVSFSSLAKSYDGTFSAQRQELVEQFGAYALLTEEFIDRVVRVIYRDFVELAVLSNKVRLPAGWSLRHLAAASYIRPAMPWIDPMKESLAFEVQRANGWISDQEIIRRRGARPSDTLDLIADWRAQRIERGLAPEEAEPDTDPAAPAAQARMAAFRQAGANED
jgi:lambda family phage portal protein